MNDRLHEILAQCAVIHRKNLEAGNIFDLEKIEASIESLDSDVAEHYASLLMQYYFQHNYLKGLQQLLLNGTRFELRMNDIADAFCHINSKEESVIEFLEEHVVMLKDQVNEEALQKIYDHYNESSNQARLEQVVELLKRNRYICAKAYKLNNEYSKFFINEDILKVIQEDLPFLLK